MKTPKHSFLYFGMFLLIVLIGIQCQKEPEFKFTVRDHSHLTEKKKKKEIKELTTRALGDTLFIPIIYGGELKVYPNTIVRCRNKKTGKFEYQALMSGDQVLPACKYQQVNYHDKVNISDTGLIRPIDTFYICRRIIK